MPSEPFVRCGPLCARSDGLRVHDGEAAVFRKEPSRDPGRDPVKVSAAQEGRAASELELGVCGLHQYGSNGNIVDDPAKASATAWLQWS